MFFNLALFSKIIGSLIAASTVSYGGYCAYDHCYPTFHNFMEREGFVWSPIDGDMKIEEAWGMDTKTAFQKMGGDWRCSKQLFNNLNPPPTDTSSADEGSSNTPTGHVVPEPTTIPESDWSNDESVGCLVADLGFAPNNQRNGFIKWELALRSKNRGFIYVGFASFGATLDLNSEKPQDTLQPETSFSLAFGISKQENTWKIGKGFSWADMLINGAGHVGSGRLKITLPNGHIWEPKGNTCIDKNKCTPPENWTFKKWVGFWEPNQSGDKQPTDALDIQVGQSSNTQSNQHDVWQTPEFDFSNANQKSTAGNTVWSFSLDNWYDDDEDKWKEARVTGDERGDRGYLKEFYKPWANQKGTWTEFDKVCYQSKVRGKLPEEESKRLLKFCYQK